MEIRLEAVSFVPLKSAMLVFVWLIGFTFGFDFGITDGMLSTPLFMEVYFPNAYKNMISHSHTLRCDFVVNLYRSSMYLVAAFIASSYAITSINTYKKIGHGAHLLVIVVFSIPGVLHIGVTICGRILFGMGIGIIIQVVATHASEMASRRYRRWVMTLFPQAISSGILMANLLFYVFRVASKTGQDVALWSLVPLVIVTGLSGLFTLDTRSALDLYFHRANELLAEALGPVGFEAARSLTRQAEISPTSIVVERKYMPPLVMVACVSIFQQLTGAYAFMIYAPVLFKAIGLGANHCLLCSSAVYGVNWIVSCLSFATIDKFKRRSLFMVGGIIMLLCKIIIIFIFCVHENLTAMPKWSVILVVVAIIAYIAGFAWSWSPLGWLVPGEILPLEIQSIGHSLYISTNMVSMFLVTQFFTMGLCEMRLGMHFVILSLVILMTIFVYLLLPETKGVEVENVSKIWTAHWFWKKFIEEDKIVISPEKSFQNV